MSRIKLDKFPDSWRKQYLPGYGGQSSEGLATFVDRNESRKVLCVIKRALNGFVVNVEDRTTTHEVMRKDDVEYEVVSERANNPSFIFDCRFPRINRGRMVKRGSIESHSQDVLQAILSQVLVMSVDGNNARNRGCKD